MYKASIKHKMGRAAFGAAIDMALKEYHKDRDKAVGTVFGYAEKYLGDANINVDLSRMKRLLADPDSAISRYVDRIITTLHPNVLKTFILNFLYEAMFCGTKKIHEARAKYQCNVPWLILMDPTSACNLHCTGCWAAEYGNKLNLTFEEMDNVIEQGKELGIFYYMFTGGEPLVRKDDLIRLAEKHQDCAFVAFTNSTLVDEKFCEDLVRVGNLGLAISLEGFEDTNDARRGQGTFDKIMHAMDLLKEHGCLFGTSIAYTRKNLDLVTSDDFVDMEIQKGVMFTMYFHLMPVGNDASPELMPTKEQREYMYHRMRELRNMEDGKGYFCFDFQNDGEFVGGCIAGGRNYFHINANGDAEPCVFIHYSNTNIRKNTLLEVLQSPLFMQYHNHQPFNDNMLRPCPMLENPEILPQMVKEAGAKSTDLQSPESAEHLTAKCKEYAKEWAPVAEKLWNGDPETARVNQERVEAERRRRNG
ncbi:MAG: radical SAM protein [Eubacterium sp.]|jgi:MoaA/NifB/PqqE/SkfB family radical SAM enzyme|uniref:radical SAM protein n=1 Tax=Eubacterium sp. F2 TaxID=3381348 RepID=UPI0039084322|nr:radical SAM protein [Eubacterium sp.]MCI2196718.1 radical SAM protein [Eubacterium sp.]